jgi:SAM-dependent methyltransferase
MVPIRTIHIAHGSRVAIIVGARSLMSAATDTVDRRSHWEGVYLQKEESRLSWHQDDPALSFQLVTRLCPRGGAVLDVGGGTSLLASRLVAGDHARVTVLDLSGAALRRAQERSGPVAAKVQWVVGDVCGPSWPTPGPFDVWHDRAVFHFLAEPEDRRTYARRVRESVRPGGHVVIATFAPDGPEQCSGLPVQRYDAPSLARELGPGLSLVESLREVHTTPWGSQQAFTYVILRREGGQ